MYNIFSLVIRLIFLSIFGLENAPIQAIDMNCANCGLWQNPRKLDLGYGMDLKLEI